MKGVGRVMNRLGMVGASYRIIDFKTVEEFKNTRSRAEALEQSPPRDGGIDGEIQFHFSYNRRAKITLHESGIRGHLISVEV